MKKSLNILSATIFATCLLLSCSNASIENDAKKVAQLQCRAQKLAQQALSGDESVIEESTKISTEASALANELKGKYSSESDKKKFTETYLEELNKCK
jgi:hypothetical protein